MKTWKREDLDRSTWGRGLWDHEPDKVQWVDEETGYDCLMVRNNFGAWCGYVGVPAEHPWFGVEYSKCKRGKKCPEYRSYPEQLKELDEWPSELREVYRKMLLHRMQGDGDPSCHCKETPEALIDVHGGITFSGKEDESDDYAKGIRREPQEGRPEVVWFFGFDCSHSDDLTPGLGVRLGTYRSREYVETEVAALAGRLRSKDPAYTDSEPRVLPTEFGPDEGT